MLDLLIDTPKNLFSSSNGLVSIDHVSLAVSPLDGAKPPTFLSVEPGDYVIVQATQQVAQQLDDPWWMGQVVFSEGGVCDPRVNTMFKSQMCMTVASDGSTVMWWLMLSDPWMDCH